MRNSTNRRRNEHRKSAPAEIPEALEPAPEDLAASASAAEPSEKKIRSKPSKIGMWDYLESDQRDADGTYTTLYRLQPVINRRHNQHFIARKNGRLCREDVLAQFGSGVFDFYVKGPDKKLLYHEQESFHSVDHPPKVDIAEVVRGHPDNEAFFATWGKQTSNGAGVTPGKKEDGKRDVDIPEILRASNEGAQAERAAHETTAAARDTLPSSSPS